MKVQKKSCTSWSSQARHNNAVPLHRLLARGGMIEAAQFRPLAWGVTMIFVALISSPHVFHF